ncbi:MAG: hypothetical protein WC496_02185 [Phycisphaerae bacterium]|jgi:hypothetical protein
MDAMNWVSLIGAAAWTPQIVTWVYWFLAKPKISLYLHTEPEIGYTTFGPIFNINLTLLSEKRDITLNKFSIRIKHESGASYTFAWAGLSESLSEIQDPLGSTSIIKKTYLPTVIRVLHTGIAQAFVRFQHEQFKAKYKENLKVALDKFQLLKISGKLRTEKDIEDLTSEKEFAEVVKLFNSEFIWREGKYTVVFDFQSPNKFNYKKSEYIFKLSQDDIDELKKNIDNTKLSLIQTAKRDIFKNYKSEEITWVWKYPELQKNDK